MNRVAIRDALVNELVSMWNHNDVSVFYENAVTADLDTVGNVIMMFVVDFSDASQINISPTPDTRQRGFLDIHMLTKETLGTRAVLSYLDELADHFGYRTLGGLHLGTPQTEKKKAPDGWFAICLTVPFFADSNT